MAEQSIIPLESIAGSIILLRGQKVILDSDLARLYGVSTKRLNEQVRRNADRFPEDFMFQVSEDEAESLRSHFATSNSGRGGRRYLPYAFTEHGVVMAASILNSPLAIEASIYVVRAFVRLREMLYTYTELAGMLEKLEGRVDSHDAQIAAIVEAIDNLIALPEPSERRIGFNAES